MSIIIDAPAAGALLGSASRALPDSFHTLALLFTPTSIRIAQQQIGEHAFQSSLIVHIPK
jgi:hypothetical protein